MSAPRPVRVLVDLSVAPPGGAGTYAAGFGRGLTEADLPAGTEVVVTVDASWAAVNRSLVDGLRDGGIEVDELDLALPGTWKARTQRGRVIRSAVRHHEIDVAFFPRDVSPRVGRPSVVLVNNLYAWLPFASSAAIGGRVPAYLLRRFAHRSARRAAAVLAVSHVMAEAVTDDIEVAAVVHHGCGLAEHRRRHDGHGDDTAPVATMVGNLIANKGIEVVIDGVAEARREGAPWELRVHGARSDPDYADRIEAHALAVLGGSAFPGPAYGDDLVEAYRRSHVVVMGGTFESFCHPLVEAMRSGCVIVAPACALVEEICGDVAVSYVEGDADSLAAALAVAWAERTDRSRRGVERSRSFTWSGAVEETIAQVRAALVRGTAVRGHAQAGS